MRAVIQRVSNARVKADNKVTGSITKGLLILLAIHRDDTEKQMNWMVEKCCRLRIFEDENGKMNKSVEDISGEILLVSQFTLYGELKKGTRPGFSASANPEKAKMMYGQMVDMFSEKMPGRIQTGIFAAKMQVLLENDGPVTIILER